MRRGFAGLAGALFGAFLAVVGCDEEHEFAGGGVGEAGEAGMAAASGGSFSTNGGTPGTDGGAPLSTGGSHAGEGAASGVAGDTEGGSGSGESKANGLPCSSDQECESEACRDEVCCDQPCDGACQACAEVHTGEPNGTCAPTLAGSDPHDDCESTAPESCGTDGSCDGAGSCRKFGPNQICAGAACMGSTFTPDRTCDGNGVCQAAAPVACGQYPCTEVGCQKPCNGDSDCPSGSYCDESKTCHNQQTDGQACTAGNQCRSEFCVDGVCCENACNGTCSACSETKTGQESGRCVGVPAGQDPDNDCAVDNVNSCGRDGACTGGGACRVRSIGTACGTATCSGNTLTPQGSCDGASSCTASTATACPGHLTCASGSACRASCSLDSHCESGYYCAGSSCMPKKGKGASCSAAKECTSGSCKDKFCCDSACSLTCQGCSNALTGLANGTCGQKTNDATLACPVNAPTICAAVQTDLNNCGTCGTTCASVPNQTRDCDSGKCEYACLDPKYTVTCSPTSNKTACSQWRFEVAGDPDGWFLVAGSNGSNGAISSSNKFAFSGSRSLAIPYTNAGFDPDNGDHRWVDVAVKVCANGGQMNLSGKNVRWKFRMDPPASSQSGYNYFEWWSDGGATMGVGGYFDFNPVTTAGWWSSTEYYTFPLGDVGSAAAIGFHLQVDSAWTGTIYIDDLEIY